MPLVPIDSDTTARRGGVITRVYQEVLNQHLLPTLHFGIIFIYDNAPIYTTVRFDDELFTQLIHLMNCMNCALNLSCLEVLSDPAFYLSHLH
jgi:hypothetical protein